MEIVRNRLHSPSNENDLDNELASYDSYEFYSSGDSQERDMDRADNRIDIELISDQKRDNLFNPVDLNDHTYDKYKFDVPFENPKSYTIQVKLPNEINCSRCVFRWIYVTGNTWGQCNSSQTEGKQGCGRQEEFRNCADIKIH